MAARTSKTITGTSASTEADVTVDAAAAPDSPTQDVPAHPVITDPQWIAVADVVTWRVPVEGAVPPRYKHRRAFAGQPVTGIGEDEAQRLLQLGGIAAAPEAPALLAERKRGIGTVPAGEVGDNELSGWEQPNLVAYVVQYPTEAERVNRIERARKDGGRAAVIRATGHDPETGERLD